MNSSDNRNAKLEAALTRVDAAPTSATFNDLVKVAGLDPARDFRFADLTGCDFRGCNLRGFDFTGARLHGARFDGALVGPGPDDNGVESSGAILRQVELSRVRHVPERDPHLPAELAAPLANVRDAADWTLLDDPRRPQLLQRPPRDTNLKIGSIFQDAPFAPELVVLPPGRFWMGSKDGEGNDDEHPQHEVTIAEPFAVGRFAITFDEWDFAQYHTDWEALTGIAPRRADEEKWGRGRRPVINVDWNDAKAYCDWLSAVSGKTYRLLSEAEWEYACRAGTATAFSFGDTISTVLANYDGNHTFGSSKKGEYRERTVEVGRFPSNAYGLHDMHGNVWEWCADAWHDTYHGAPDDGSARESDDKSLSRVLRGGSWGARPEALRSADRFGFLPDYRDRGFGFRLARTLNPSS